LLNLQIQLSDAQLRTIRRAFRRSRFKDQEEVAGALAQLAVDAWIDWLAGDQRYNSLTEQHTDWFEQIYTQLLPESEVPSADRLYNSFNVPFGRAQYIARVLSNKRLTHWRELAVQRLREAMAAKLADVDKWVAAGETGAKAEIVIDKLAFLELQAIHNDLFLDDPQGVAPMRCDIQGNVHAVLVPAGCFRRIYEAIEA
jgi:hypothetical protein